MNEEIALVELLMNNESQTQDKCFRTMCEHVLTLQWRTNIYSPLRNITN